MFGDRDGLHVHHYTTVAMETALRLFWGGVSLNAGR